MLGQLLNRFFASRAILLLAAVVVIAALLLLAGALPNAVFKAGAPLPPDLLSNRPAIPPILPELFPRIWDVLMIVLWSAFLVALGFLIFDRKRHPILGEVVFQVVYALLWIALLFFFSRALRAEPPPLEEESAVEPLLPAATLEAPALEGQLEELALTAEPPLLLEYVLTALFAVGLTTLLYGWWRQRRTRRREPTPLNDLSRRARLALDELRRGEQVEEVILRCYREMARTVAVQRGVQRGQGVTPREFEAALREQKLPPHAVQRLTRLFEQVRYGNHAPGQRERLEAVDSLQAIVAACEPRATGREQQP